MPNHKAFLCPVDILSPTYTKNQRNNELSSYVMNGAICGYSGPQGSNPTPLAKAQPFGVRPPATCNGSRTRIHSAPEIRARLNSMTPPISHQHPLRAVRVSGGCTTRTAATVWRWTGTRNLLWRKLSPRIQTLRRARDPVREARRICGGARSARTGTSSRVSRGGGWPVTLHVVFGVRPALRPQRLTWEPPQ